MKQVLAVLGSNFLGHITNVYPILNFFKNQKFDIKVIILPLSKVDNPPILNFLKEKKINYEYYNLFEYSMKSKKNIFSYYDLLYQHGFSDINKLTSYYNFIDKLLLNNKVDLVLSDFTMFTGSLCMKKGIPFVAIRSHSLKVSFLNNKKIELFNWWDTMPTENLIMIEKMKNNLMQVGNFNLPEEVFYSDITITPGFYPFDDVYPDFTKHYFIIDKQESKLKLPKKDVYLYIRDDTILNRVIFILEKFNKSYWIVDTKLKDKFINLWQSIPSSSLIISHGGHGICLWAIYNKLFHLIIPDNNDRLSNAKRVKELNFGLYTVLEDLDKDLKYSLFASQYNKNNAVLINKSISYEDISYILLERININEKR